MNPPADVQVLYPPMSNPARYVAVIWTVAFLLVGFLVYMAVAVTLIDAAALVLAVPMAVAILLSVSRAVREARYGRLMEPNGVWMTTWRGWRCYSRDEIEAVEWKVGEDSESPAVVSYVFLRFHAKWRRRLVIHTKVGFVAEEVATRVGTVLHRPVVRSRWDKSHKLREREQK